MLLHLGHTLKVIAFHQFLSIYTACIPNEAHTIEPGPCKVPLQGWSLLHWLPFDKWSSMRNIRHTAYINNFMGMCIKWIILTAAHSSSCIALIEAHNNSVGYYPKKCVLALVGFVPIHATAHDEVFLAVYEKSKREPSMTQTLWAFRARVTLESLSRAFTSMSNAKALHPLLHAFLHEVSYCCHGEVRSIMSLVSLVVCKWLGSTIDQVCYNYYLLLSCTVHVTSNLLFPWTCCIGNLWIRMRPSAGIRETSTDALQRFRKHLMKRLQNQQKEFVDPKCRDAPDTMLSRLMGVQYLLEAQCLLHQVQC